MSNEQRAGDLQERSNEVGTPSLHPSRCITDTQYRVGSAEKEITDVKQNGRYG